MQRGLLAVFAAPTSEQHDDALNRWYDDVHIVEILQVAGFVAATRYRTTPGMPTPFETTPYLTLYEVEAPSMTEAMDAMAAARSTFEQTTALQRNPGPVLLWFDEVTSRRAVTS